MGKGVSNGPSKDQSKDISVGVSKGTNKCLSMNVIVIQVMSKGVSMIRVKSMSKDKQR